MADRKKKPAARAAAKKPAKKKSAPAAKRASAPKKKAAPAKRSAAKRSAPAKRPRTSKRPALKPKRPAVRAKRPSHVEPLANPEGLKLAKLAASVVAEKKALDVTIIDVRSRGAAVGYDYLVLATGESDRQLDAMGDALREAGKSVERRPTSTESSPDWVLVNFDDVVVHLFTPEKRALYDLDGLWSDAPRVGAFG